MAQDASLKVLLDDARRATQRRDWPDALRCWNLFRERFPDDPRGHLGAGNVLRDTGRLDDAEALLAEAADRFPQHEPIALARAWTANQRRDWPTAVKRWAAFRQSAPDNAWGHYGASAALRAIGRDAEAGAALDAAEAALARTKDSRFGGDDLARLELEIAKARGDWSRVRQAVEAAIAAAPVAPAALFLSLAQACWQLRDTDAADDAAANALAVNPALTEALLICAQAAIERGDGESALGHYRTLARLHPDNVRWPIQVILLLNRIGRVNDAASELETVRGRWPNDPTIKSFVLRFGLGQAPTPATVPADAAFGGAEERALRAIFAKAPTDAELARPPISNDPKQEVIVATASGATTAVLVFAGSNDQVALPLRMFDRFLASFGVSAIYLKDFQRLRFLKGVQSLGANYAATAAALRKMAADLGARRLCVIGNCDGAFAAIRYGVELRADCILAFSPPTHSPREKLARLEQGRNLMRVRLQANVPEDMTDLKPFIERSARKPRIELFYEPDNPRDAVHAIHLSGVPGVTLNPVPGSQDHRVLQWMAEQDGFRERLRELIGA